jgi:hypothetical protein
MCNACHQHAKAWGQSKPHIHQLLKRTITTCQGDPSPSRINRNGLC